MARQMIFNATFCYGNMLQQYEVDSNCCNIVARTLSELVRVTPSPSTFNATLYPNAPRESRNKSRDQSTSACQKSSRVTSPLTVKQIAHILHMLTIMLFN